MKRNGVYAKLMGTAACLLAAACLFGCGSADTEQSTGIVKEEIPEAEDTDSTEEGNENSENTETGTDAEEAGGAEEEASANGDSAFAVYQDFLNGDGLVYFDNFADMSQADRDDYEFLADDLAAGTGYSFSEFTGNYQKGMSNVYPDMELTTEYAEIDCGNDGVPELAVRTTLEGNSDMFNDIFIFKQTDDKLQCVFIAGYGYRTEAVLNSCGYYTASGSNSAFSSGTTTKYIDSDGQIKFDYTVDDMFSTSGLWVPDKDFQTVAEEQGISEKIEILQYAFSQADDSTDFTEYYNNCMYCFIPTNENYEPLEGDDLTAAYADGSPYMNFWNSTGLTLYTQEEIDAAIAGHEAEIGVTDEIKNAPEAEWNVIS